MSVEMAAVPLPAAPNLVTQFYYKVGDHTLLLEPDTMAEVLLNAVTAPLPYPPSWCHGLVSMRGELLPLVDMHHVLYGQPTPAAKSTLLWIKPEQSPAIVVLCDSYPKVLKLTSDTPIMADPATNLPSWMMGWKVHEQQAFLVANHALLIRKLIQATSG